MIFTKAKIAIIGIAVLTIGLTIWAGYTYVTNLQKKVEFLSGEVKTLEISNKTLTAERAQLKTDLKENKRNQEILNTELREARKGKDELIKLFSDHDFAKLVEKKPGLIEIRINKATDKVFKELEDISNE